MEHLLITTLTKHTTFTFTHTLPISSEFIPASILDLKQEFKINYLKTSLSQGRDFKHPPSGLFFNSSCFRPSLAASLSGLLCASINLIDPIKIHHSYIALLPREPVCTENLTPWVKLLACKSSAGLASLFNSYKLFNANYHSISFHLNDTHFHQSLVLILDSNRLLGKSNWSLKEFFGSDIKKHCPVVESGITLIGGNDMMFDQDPDSIIDGPYKNSRSYNFNLFNKTDFNLAVWYPDDRKAILEERFSVDRYLTGYGQERGGISFTFTNPSLAIKINVLQIIPWYLKLYLSSLKTDAQVLNISYVPSIDRLRPTTLNLDLLIPSGQSTLSIEYDKAFIRYTEHPPDANRGFDIGAAIIEYNGDVYYTTSLIINLPTPDFSMPYNVITLTCTVLALLFGSMYNYMIRDFKPLTQ